MRPGAFRFDGLNRSVAKGRLCECASQTEGRVIPASTISVADLTAVTFSAAKSLLSFNFSSGSRQASTPRSGRFGTSRLHSALLRHPAARWVPSGRSDCRPAGGMLWEVAVVAAEQRLTEVAARSADVMPFCLASTTPAPGRTMDGDAAAALVVAAITMQARSGARGVCTDHSLSARIISLCLAGRAENPD